MIETNNDIKMAEEMPSLSNNQKKYKKIENYLTIPKDLYVKYNDLTFESSKLDNLIKALYSKEINEKYYGLVGIRKLLSLIEIKEIISKINEMQLIPKFIDILDNDPYEFKYQALWCLTNIATGNTEQIMNIILYGGINKIMDCLDSDIEEIVLQSIWIFGNLAADSNQIKQILSNKGFFDKILNILSFNNNEEIIKLGAWAICNFLRNNECLPFEKAFQIFKIFSKNLVEINCINKDFIKDTCLIISKVTFNQKVIINEIIKINKLIQKIISFLDIEDENIKFYSLNIINDISTGDIENVQKLMDFNVLEKLKLMLLNETKPNIIENVAWILSNIACENEKIVESLVENDFIRILINTFNTNAEMKVKKASLFAICNIFDKIKNKEEYIEKIMKEGFIKILFESMSIEDPECIIISIEIIKQILDLDKKMHPNIKPFKLLLQKLGINKILEKLKLYPNEQVQCYVEKIKSKI